MKPFNDKPTISDFCTVSGKAFIWQFSDKCLCHRFL